MLKSLIQLFAESYLKSKKSWLFKNSFGYETTFTSVLEQTPPGVDSVSYTAPSDGLLFARYGREQGNTNPYSCRAKVNGVVKYELHGTGGWALQNSFYVAKGDSIVIESAQKTVVQVRFYPSI